MIEQNTLQGALEENFARYSAMTIQARAICDVRDMMKPGARQGVYAQYLAKLYPTKPYKKAASSVAAAMDRFYTHGDAPMHSLLMRLGKPFASRYLLEDIQGNIGNLMESDNHSAARYVEMRLNHLSMKLFENIEKGVIDTWYESYNGEDKYPDALPSLGFYNIVNGTMGIATAIASSIPQFNLREVNAAMIKLLWNPDIEDDAIICLPDFATGATLLNEEEVRASLKKGTGSSCSLRATIKYDAKDNCLVVTEIPYGVYTNTICEQIEELVNEQPDLGIERLLDLTGQEPLIKIYLNKGAQPQTVLSVLYKKTALQSHFGINMTMLKDGKKPEVFTWKQALTEHLQHEHKCYTAAFRFDLQKAKDKLHIVDGYIIACANINEVVDVIKNSESTADAQKQLISNFELSTIQANAVLKLTLAKITSLEVKKYQKEKQDLLTEIERISHILNDESLLKKVIEKGLRDVATKYGDDRRTKIVNIDEEEEARVLYFTTSGKVYLNKPKSETILNTIISGVPYLAVTQKGIVYRSNEVPKRAKAIFNIESGDKLIGVFPAHESDYLVIYSQEKNFRCTPITSLNKKKTTLSINNLVDAYVSPVRLTKAEYKRK